MLWIYFWSAGLLTRGDCNHVSVTVQDVQGQAMKAPAFLCYASNIIADKRYRLMTPSERFVWISIYLECWPNQSVPAAPDELARYLGYPEEDVKAGLTERVLSFFRVDNGELTSPDLEEYREKNRLLNLKKSEGGKKGAERKRDMVSKKAGNVQGAPLGIPEGSLNQSKPNQSNQNQFTRKGINPISDSWLEEYKKTERKEAEAYARASKGG